MPESPPLRDHWCQSTARNWAGKPDPLQHCAYTPEYGAWMQGLGRDGPHDRQSSHSDSLPSCSSLHKWSGKHLDQSGGEQTRWWARSGWSADPGHREPRPVNQSSPLRQFANRALAHQPSLHGSWLRASLPESGTGYSFLHRENIQ